MDDGDDAGSGGVWRGLSTLLVAALGFGVFALGAGPVDTGGVVASVALAAVGLAQLLAPRVSPWFGRLAPHWLGLFWVLAGVGLAALGVLAADGAGRLGSGLLLGAGFALYGCLTALDR